MNPSGHDDLSKLSMLELFRAEAEGQTAALTAGLLELERLNRRESGDAAMAPILESLMRAAHSLKGAARIVNLGAAVRVAHAMEDCFVAAQQGRLQIGQAQIDTLLRGVDLLLQISKCNEPDLSAWEQRNAGEVEVFVGTARAVSQGDTVHGPQSTIHSQDSAIGTRDSGLLVTPELAGKPERPERVVRLNAENLNRLLGLAGESLVETRWLRPFTDSMQRLKRMQSELEASLVSLKSKASSLKSGLRPEALDFNLFSSLVEQAVATREFLGERLEELDGYDRRSAHLSSRLYLEVLRSRMRPFGEGTQRFPRMVRDLAHSLGKQVRLELVGEHTQVDRDILEQLETPLAHLLRNAVDHGCELPGERVAAGKGAEGLIVLEARHSAGLLLVTVSDDGRGVDTERVRQVIVARGLTNAAVAQRMSEGELLEFLFLPGFTLKETVTELSGRGVGLDVVQNLVKSVRGTVRVATAAGRGLRFQLQLPLTLSVLRTLLVEVAGEPYAIPLGHIAQALRVEREQLEWLEGRPHFAFGDQRVGLLSAQAVLGIDPQFKMQNEKLKMKPRRGGGHFEFCISNFELSRAEDRKWSMEDGTKRPSSILHPPSSSGLAVVVLGERQGCMGLAVDRFLGERELVVQPLDGRLGKVPGISAAALLEDGAPVLIMDVDDLLCSADTLKDSLKFNVQSLMSGGSGAWGQGAGPDTSHLLPRTKKRVLAVDDSLTVRELVRKLLLSRGYLAEVAVDGMDGWKAVRSGGYDLVITDVDMPRMDGIELARRIKGDAQLKSLPVMIVSYKDREEDRMRGLEAGADYYLSKGSFHDESLLQAVWDLIGEAEE